MPLSGKIIVLIGLCLGFVVAVCIGLIALDHNPQETWSQNPMDLLLLSYSWLSAISFPFLLIGLILGWKKGNSQL